MKSAKAGWCGFPAQTNTTNTTKTRVTTVRTRIIGPCVRTLELPLPVRFGVFLFLFYLARRAGFLVGFRLFQEKELLNYLAHGPTIRDLTPRQTRRKAWLVALIPVPLLNIFISQLRCCPTRARNHLSFPELPFAINLTTNNRKAIIVLSRVECLVIGQKQDFVNCCPEGCPKGRSDPYTELC